MKYILMYINISNIATKYLNKEFPNLAELETYVLDNHPEFTSYEIVVIRRNKEIIND